MIKRQPSSIRWSLLRSFATLVLLSSMTVLAFMTVRAVETERKLSENLIRAGSLQAERALNAFIDPAREATAVGVSWGHSGRLELDTVVSGEPGKVTPDQVEQAHQLATLLLPILESQEELSSVQIATERGEGFLLLQTQQETRIRIVNRPRWGASTLWFTIEPDGALADPQWREVDYRPTERPWYTVLEDRPPGEVAWTDPYIFFTTGDLGITASSAWHRDGVRYVIAWDVLLTAVTRFTQGVSSELSQRSSIIVMTPDQKVIGLPRHEAYSTEEAIRSGFLEPLGELHAPEARAMVAAATGRELPTSFNFDSQGDTWWVGLREYRLGQRHKLQMAVLVPDGDLLREVARQRVILLGATALALLAALVYSLLLARSYSRPLEALAAQSEKIQKLDFDQEEQVDARLIEFQTLANAQNQSLRALQSFSKYVPLDVVHELVKTDQVARIGGRKESVTILFTDIAGFTAIAETLTPEQLAAHLAEYFDCVVHELQRHNATVDKLIGDAVMAFWGAPRSMKDHARKAVAGTVAARQALNVANRRWQATGHPALPTRFGLASGEVIVGNIGAQDRLAYTVMGDTVNLASRLEGLNKAYGTTVIAEESVVSASGDDFAWRRLDRVRVVGRSGATWVYELLDEGFPRELSAEYERAWDLYQDRSFTAATDILEGLVERFGDEPSRRLLRRCRDLATHPPADDWDGITNLRSK